MQLQLVQAKDNNKKKKRKTRWKQNSPELAVFNIVELRLRTSEYDKRFGTKNCDSTMVEIGTSLLKNIFHIKINKSFKKNHEKSNKMKKKVYNNNNNKIKDAIYNKPFEKSWKINILISYTRW